MYPQCDKCEKEPAYIAVICSKGHKHMQCEYCAPATVAEYLKSLDIKHE